MYIFAYYNGSKADPKKIAIPLSDRALFYGDGVYDAAIGQRGKILFKDEHLERFYKNQSRLEIVPRISQAELSELLDDLVKELIEPFFLYFQTSRTSDERVHHSCRAGRSSLLITAKPMPPHDCSKRLRLTTFEDMRYGYCDIKTLNLLPSVLAATEAERLGCDEAVFHKGDTVTECSRSNIFILKSGRLITHPQSRQILSGITRSHLISTARSHGIAVHERPFTVGEMLLADEVLITGTSRFCLAAECVNGEKIGGKDANTADMLCRAIYKEFTVLGT